MIKLVAPSLEHMQDNYAILLSSEAYTHHIQRTNEKRRRKVLVKNVVTVLDLLFDFDVKRGVYGCPARDTPIVASILGFNQRSLHTFIVKP